MSFPAIYNVGCNLLTDLKCRVLKAIIKQKCVHYSLFTFLYLTLYY